MLRNEISAKHIGTGVWKFECLAHEPDPLGHQQLSSPRHCFDVMEKHIDQEHPGERFTMVMESDWSGNRRKSHRGKRPETNVDIQ